MMGKQSNIVEFIEKSKKIHKDEYDYSKVVYVNNRKPIKIICKTHGCFFQRPDVHLRGCGCYECGREKTTNSKRIDANEFIKRARGVHGSKYDYSSINYVNNKKKIMIVCPTHGEFAQTPINHLHYGCATCNSSQGETKIFNFLRDNKIDFLRQKTFDDCKNTETNGSLRFDFYVPSKNLLIEYDGMQHFKPGIFGNYTFSIKDVKETQHRDKLKNRYAKTKGIRLLRIGYKKLKQINEILSKEFLVQTK